MLHACWTLASASRLCAARWLRSPSGRADVAAGGGSARPFFVRCPFSVELASYFSTLERLDRAPV